ncbi:MAG: hypothetical protein P1U63_08900 [Coxiellaceae bacterium]|nr:hypothetical protein [Coxiellaceae bacterium]
MRHLLHNQQTTKQSAYLGLCTCLFVAVPMYVIIDSVRNIMYGFSDEHTWRHQPPMNTQTIAGIVATGALCGLFAFAFSIQAHNRHNAVAAIHLTDQDIERLELGTLSAAAAA